MTDAAKNSKVQDGIDFVKPPRGHWVILWDIDGTLMSSNGAGRASMEYVFERMYGVPHGLDGIELAGRTDAAILLDLFRGNDFDPLPEVLEDFRRRYFNRLREVIRSLHTPTALPGILDAMARLETDPGCILGLLTGNWRTSAYIKLNSVRLDHRFPTGAFAEDAPTRPELLPVALSRLQGDGHHGISFEKTVIIGDTPHDIAVAKAHGARSVAVATGIHDADVLEHAQPDLLFHTFDTDRFLCELALWNSGT